jgi:hypothetical protein
MEDGILYWSLLAEEDQVKSSCIAHRLWHLSKIFSPTITFKINESYNNSLFLSGGFEHVLRKVGDNFFFIFVSGENEDYLQKLISFIDFSFSEAYPNVKFYFIRF